MKIIDQNDAPNCEGSGCGRNIFIGITFVVVGLIWLLHNFDVLSEQVFDVIFSWQMLLVVIGGYLCSQRKWAPGAIVAAIGICFAVTDLIGIHIPVHKVIVPVVFIAVGLSVILTRKRL